MYHSECNNICEIRRARLYMFYGTLLCALVILAGSHFVLFFVTRRRYKRELHDYVARKQEFVASLQQQEKESKESAQAEKEIEEEEEERYTNCGVEDTNYDHIRPQDELHDPPPRQPSALSMVHSREIGGILPGLKRIEEERQSELSRCSTSSTSSGNFVREALHQPVILTVATVSSLFVQEEKASHEEEKSRVENRRRSGYSVTDISDIIRSPERNVSQIQQESSRDMKLPGLYVKREIDQNNMNRRTCNEYHLNQASEESE
ncbi:unnamed protein product [Orchesella dallaii]|uniref:Uncharacterized protein n=1 Tax=Orchesella dallaii TaxID=48710 RepID=A0ABP1QNU0_9HEXA